MKHHRHNRLKAAGNDNPATNGWQIVYTGFILILLCFFIMLTSFASLQQSRITQFSRAFSHAVNVFSGGASLEKGSTMIHQGAAAVKRADEVARLFETIRQLGQAQQMDGIDLKRSEGGVILTLSDRLLFQSADARLMRNADPLLKKVGHIIRNVGVPVEIEGHTDDRPIRSDRYPSNWELSTARAVTVLRHLVQQENVKPRNLSAVGCSKYRPLVSNDSTEHRARNRRVEFIFKAKGFTDSE